MKIAQVAPPWIAVPPHGYGGIEWVVALLADGLVERGHDVTLFATGDSQTKATLDAIFETAPGPTSIGDTYLETIHANHAYERAHEFDIVHEHTSFVGLAMAARLGLPVIHTLHGQLEDRMVDWYRSLGERVHLVSISDSQREPAPDLNYAGRVYNGVPVEHYPYVEDKEDFLLFVGRAGHAKGPHVAVEVAKRTGSKLVMAVAIKEKAEQQHWDEVVVPSLTGNETILTEITLEAKADLMGRARAVLFPIDWPEPFGLVMAEANACGTPVLAFPRGAAPEVIADGETGFMCRDVDDMCDAVGRAASISAAACRARVEKHFSAEVMCEGYERVFERVLGR